MTKVKIAIYFILLFFVFAPAAQAYVDPGTGSFLFQLLIAGFFAGLFFLKNIVRSVRNFFAQLFLRKAKPVYDEVEEIVESKNE